MTEQNQAADNAQDANAGQANGRPFGDMYGIIIAGTWACIGLLLLALFWPNMAERAKFFVSTLWIVVTAFAVIAQVHIYRQQWRIMQAQIERFDIVERAYVGIKDILIRDVEAGEPLTITIVFQNGGRTPAWDVQCEAHLICSPYKRDPVGWSPKGMFFLPAGFEKHMRIVFDFIPDVVQVEKIKRAESVLILYGKLAYKDFRRQPRPPYMFSAI